MLCYLMRRMAMRYGDGLDFDIPLDSRLCKMWLAQHHRRWLRLRGASLGASRGGKGSLVGYGFSFF